MIQAVFVGELFALRERWNEHPPVGQDIEDVPIRFAERIETVGTFGRHSVSDDKRWIRFDRLSTNVAINHVEWYGASMAQTIRVVDGHALSTTFAEAGRFVAYVSHAGPGGKHGANVSDIGHNFIETEVSWHKLDRSRLNQHGSIVIEPEISPTLADIPCRTAEQLDRLLESAWTNGDGLIRLQ